jgi:predicted 3-demethylubiquinone-9 3-methyltransferase (glyoxalase superfamily)
LSLGVGGGTRQGDAACSWQDQPMTTVTPFLMFEGNAEEAMNRYVGALPGSQVLRLERYGPEGPGPEGTVSLAEAELAGQRVRFFDSFVHHDFTFTPALSLFVTVPSADEFDVVVDALSPGGGFLMPPGDYGFSPRFAWFNDEYGVSWQVNVEG